eukprot:EG_transcript_5257
MAALRLPQLNKGAAFTREERDTLHLSGLLPPAVRSMKEQLEQLYRTYKTIRSPLEKYQHLRSLQERNEHLYFAFVAQHLEEVLPIIYTPTVGDACMNYSFLYHYPRGLSFSVENIDQAETILQEYHLKDVRMVVVTDSSAILGLGDQGYGGIGIPIGKLAVYTAAGGICPFQTCPIALDVGTNRADLLNDPMYLGIKMHRLTGKPYMELVGKFVKAVKKVWPKAMVQWEDLTKENAHSVSERFKDEICSFNDDIQGTGAMTLAGVLAASRKMGKKLSDQRIVVSGAGAGGTGVTRALREGMMREGLSAEEARSRVLVLDSTGLLYEGRDGMEPYKLEYAQPAAAAKAMSRSGGIPTLLETVVASKCTCLIGVSGRPGQFSEPIVRAVAANTPTPIIMPLSNPTSSAEAFPVDIVEWTDNTAIIACGSPFNDVHPLYREAVPVGQGNNAFIFPGLGAGVMVVGATKITTNMVMEAGYAVADYCCEHWPEAKRMYPPVSEMRKVSRAVAKRVALQAVKDGVASDVTPGESEHSILARVDASFWEPVYPEVRLSK